MKDGESRNAASRAGRFAVQFVAALVALYLLVAVVAMIDELVLESHWITDRLPEPVVDGLGWALHPVGLLLEALGIID